MDYTLVIYSTWMDGALMSARALIRDMEILSCRPSAFNNQWIVKVRIDEYEQATVEGQLNYILNSPTRTLVWWNRKEAA